MKKSLFAAAAMSIALVTTAATAQIPPPPGWHGGIVWDREAFWRAAPANPFERIQFLQDRVDHGLANGSLDPHEAARVTGELHAVRGWIRDKHWEDGGRLTPEQGAHLQERLDQISRQIHWLQRTGW